MDQIKSLDNFPVGYSDEEKSKRTELFSCWVNWKMLELSTCTSGCLQDVTGNGELALAEVNNFLSWLGALRTKSNIQNSLFEVGVAQFESQQDIFKNIP